MSRKPKKTESEVVVGDMRHHSKSAKSKNSNESTSAKAKPIAKTATKPTKPSAGPVVGSMEEHPEAMVAPVAASPATTEVEPGGVSKPAQTVALTHSHVSLSSGQKLAFKLVVMAIVLAGIVGGTIWWLHVRNGVGCFNRSQNSVLHQSAAGLNPKLDLTKLKTATDNILKTGNYQKSPSCLGVLTTYYIDIGDPKNAQTYYDQLNAIYKPTDGYDAVVAPYLQPPVKLKPMIDVLNAQVKSNDYDKSELNL